ncbi:MAG: 5-(carboxyamino)imidazole ribonucleotide mutase [Alphaproteobacteria bacterium]|nr:MAG: 5-(carboxyamino)imidazole ribonucleotide mutase [Alphaproteobacteria bacterium]
MVNKNTNYLVGIIMGSQSDWEVMKEAKDQLDEFSITNEQLIISAHRTPNRILDYAKKSLKNGVKVIIAGAGGAAHLPGMMASHTQIPVIGVPIESTSLNGIDSLLSIVQMPKGIPVATVSIGKTGAKNAAILAAEILSLQDEQIRKKLSSWKISMTNNVPYKPE